VLSGYGLVDLPDRLPAEDLIGGYRKPLTGSFRAGSDLTQ
jgi:hypothetical protein